MIKERGRGFFINSNSKYGQYLAQVGIVAVIYFGIAKLSLAITGHPSPVWPPAGFAFAVILLFGYRQWPGIALGTFMEVILEGLPVPIAFTTAAGSAAGALAGAYLFNRLGFQNSMERPWDVLGLAVLGSAVSPISATTGTASFYLSGIIPWAASGSFWMTWWLGDVLGVIVVAPVFLAWSKRPRFDLKPKQIPEALTLMVLLVLVSDIVLKNPVAYISSKYMLFPFLIWAALRFGQKGATTAIIIVSGIAIWHTSHGHGPFAVETLADNLIDLQIFTFIVALTVMILAAIMAERNLIENTLKKEKTFTEDALNSFKDVFYVFDLNGTLLRWNNALSAITGYSDKEISTKKPTDFFLGEDIRNISTAIEMMVRNGTVKVEADLVTKNGEQINYEFTGTLLKDPDGKPLGICGIGRNTSEIKKAALEYKTILLTAMDGFFLVDTQGRIQDVNDSYCSLIGYSREELLNMSVKDVDVSDTEEGIAQRIKRVMEVGWDRFETRHKCKDGRIIEIEASVNYDKAGGGKFFAFMRDITENKRIVEMLKESEERFRSITQSVNDAIITADCKGDIIFWNNAAYKIFGYDNEEVIGKPLTILMPEIYRDEHRNGLKRLLASGDSHVIGKTVELSGLRKDSTVFPLELSLSTWKAGETIFFTGILRDITERKHAVESLRCSEARLAAFMNSATDAFTIWDSKLNLVELNKVASRYLPWGVKRSDVIGKNIKVLEPDAKPSGRFDQFLNVIKTGEPLTLDILTLQLNFDNVAADRYLNIRAFKVGDGLGLITTDITERKHMEEELTQSEEKYRTLYESSSDAIMLLDEKGFFDCNYATIQIFGFSNKEDIIKLNPSQVSPPYQPDGVDSSLAANNKIADALTKGTNQFEWVHRRKNGEDFHADVLLSAFNLRGKQVLQATVRDITDRKRAQELHIENVQLENESKAKSEFLASMSHELRTPLNAILGFSEIMTLGIGGNLNETHKGYVKDIYNAGNHLLLIIDDILDLSKVEAGKMELVIEKFSMLELLEETLTLIKYKAIKHNIEIIRDIDSQLDFIDGDKKRIKQVLFNLLSNAVKFSKEGGGTITIAVKKIDGMANFSVSDTGIGIEEKNLNKLFKEFQQLDTGITRKYGGTGLGLMISKKLVELHGGKITAKSVYGEGSTFTFSIPLRQGVN